ncbi:MAG: hypothetical protein ACSHXF_04180 [Aquaticitalea sp.]
MNNRQKIDRISQELFNEISSSNANLYAFDKMVVDAIEKSSKIIKTDEATTKMFVFAYSYYLFEKGITPPQTINPKRIQKLFNRTFEHFIRDFHKELNHSGLRELVDKKDITSFYPEFMTPEDHEDLLKMYAIMDSAFEKQKFLGKELDDEVQEKLLSQIRKYLENHV